jgi:prepilin-type N-terminal cleavage/methylation domain-containing protein
MKTYDDGFSMVELIVALCLFSIGMLGAAGVLIATHNGTLYSKNFSEAVALAEEKIEALRRVNFDTVEGECGTAEESEPYTLSCEIAPYTDMGLKQVAVTVQWPYRAGMKEIMIASLVAS